MEWLDPVVFSGKCHYACITEPNTKFEPVWSILVEVDDDNRKIIEDAISGNNKFVSGVGFGFFENNTVLDPTNNPRN